MPDWLWSHNQLIAATYSSDLFSIDTVVVHFCASFKHDRLSDPCPGSDLAIRVGEVFSGDLRTSFFEGGMHPLFNFPGLYAFLYFWK
jgi:hypothetical protein